MTAVSCYVFMAVIEFLTTPEGEMGSVLGFLWPVKGVFREFEKEKREGNGHLKGRGE